MLPLYATHQLSQPITPDVTLFQDGNDIYAGGNDMRLTCTAGCNDAGMFMPGGSCTSPVAADLGPRGSCVSSCSSCSVCPSGAYFEGYSDNSAWFKAHPDVLKWVNRDMSSAKNNGAMKCEAAQFGDIDPFPGHKKICQCARGVGIDVFEPYSVTESEAEKGNLKPKGTLPVTPQVIIKSASEAAVASVGSGEAKRVFHHEFQPRDRHLEARDLAKGDGGLGNPADFTYPPYRSNWNAICVLSRVI